MKSVYHANNLHRSIRIKSVEDGKGTHRPIMLRAPRDFEADVSGCGDGEADGEDLGLVAVVGFSAFAVDVRPFPFSCPFAAFFLREVLEAPISR